MPDIQIKTLDGQSFGAYCSMPPSGKGPGMIVIQEIFGVNANMRAVADHYASLGYIAVCPDLFWRQQPGIQLTDKTPAEWDRAMELFQGFDVEAGVRDLLSTLAHVRSMKGDGGKVGAVGFCLGGKLAYLMASRSDVEASVSYYGVGLDQMLDEVHDIRMPLMVHIAGLDKYCPPPVREKLLKGLARNPVITAYVYDKADHAFARINGQNYNKEAADLANRRTEAFFAEHLRS
jgi:carboxymethylenebutenolidase